MFRSSQEITLMLRTVLMYLRRRLLKSKATTKFPELQKLVSAFDRPSAQPLGLYFGDSVSLRISSFDQDKRPLPEILGEELKACTHLIAVPHSAYHAKVYRGLLTALRKMSAKPEFVVIPINPRSFSPQWDLEPSWQFDEELECIANYVHTGTIAPVFRKMDLESGYEAFDSAPVAVKGSPLCHVGEFRLVIGCSPKTETQKRFRSRQLFLFHYCPTVEADHRKVIALEDCARMLREDGVKTLIYVTPVNCEAGVRFVGPEFRDMLKANLHTILERINRAAWPGLLIADYSDFLGESCFFDVNSPTEHLNQAGRKILATQLAGLIERLMKNGA